MKIILTTPGCNIYKESKEFVKVTQPFVRPYTEASVTETLSNLKTSKADFALQYYDPELLALLTQLDIRVAMLIWEEDQVESQVGACYLTRIHNPEHLLDSGVDVMDTDSNFTKLFRTIRTEQRRGSALATSTIDNSDYEPTLRFFETVVSLEI